MRRLMSKISEDGFGSHNLFDIDDMNDVDDDDAIDRTWNARRVHLPY